MKTKNIVVDKSLFNNNWFRKDIPKFKWALWLVVSGLFFESRIILPNTMKTMLLRLFGAKVGSNCIIKPGVKIKFPWKLEAGNRVSFGEMVWIDNLGLVKLGNNVTISQGAYLCTGNHDFRKVSFDLIVGEISLADGVWIGAHSCVGPGITMGISSIVTMNSVLTTDTNDFGIYQGNPAKYVKKRTLEL